MPKTACAAPPLIGIFVGGRGTRLGNRAKGLIKRADGKTLLQATLEACARGSPGSPVVLVGQHDAYQGSNQPVLLDRPSGIGPLGGLCSLLLEAERLGLAAVALACDQPLLDSRLIARIATEAQASAVATHDEHGWQPFCARYAPGEVLGLVRANIATGNYSLQSLFDQLGDRACALTLTASEARALADCDTKSAALDLGLILDD